MVAPFLEPLRLVSECLESLGVAFFVGGSVASTMHGEIRTTQDVDLVVELEESHIGPFVAALRAAFYVDEEAVLDAVRRRGSCNLIHLETAFKVDLFVRRERPFSRSEMQRRERIDVGGLRLPIATAEDSVLTKLEWFEKGGRVSDRQWRDVLGVIKGRGADLDAAYLERWSAELGVRDLLVRALREAKG
ncbi:MAG: hypothetical protein KDE27_16255 [Planctomycetes bacterium]|nr:hypothetical protein [Planctomycetota bacterium]